MALNALTEKFYRFGEFHIDVKNRLLLRRSEIIPLTPKAFDLLLIFVENPGALLEKEELMERVWGNLFVEEGNLARNVSSLRKALGENPKAPEYIVTVTGHGYRFVADVEDISTAEGRTLREQASPTFLREAPRLTETQGHSASVNAIGISRERTGLPTPAIIGICAFCLIVAIVVAFMFLRPNRTELASPPVGLKTIAVLPSRPSAAEDRDPASEFGLAASLINRLSRIRSLIVRPAAAMVKYTSIDQDPIDAGREQQVNYVLASSYQKIGEKVVLTAQLISVNDGAVLWSDKCEEQCNTFAWQDDLAEKTTRSMLRTLTDAHRLAVTKHGTENQRAYDLFNLGLYGWYANTYDTERLIKSAGYLEQAIALDPNYANAYALLATINSRLGISAGSGRKEYERKANELADKALELDPTVVEAHLVLGVSAFTYHWNWSKADEHFKRARELNPDDVGVARTYASYLASLGRLDESLFWQQRACDLQPLSFDLNAVLVMRLFLARRYDQAIQQARKALQMVPAPQTMYFAWRCFEEQHMYEEAYRALQELIAAEKQPDTAALVARSYATSGYERARSAYLSRRLRNLETRAQEAMFNPLEAAIMCALLGNRDEAFKWLEKAYDCHAQELIYLKVTPEFDNLRSDPRFSDLTRRIGLMD